MQNQRKKKISDLSEVSTYLQALIEKGYTRRGNWSLGQNCEHLAIVMEFSQRVTATRLGSLAERMGGPLFMMTMGRIATRMGIRLPAFAFARPNLSAPIDDVEGVQRLVNAITKQQCHIGAKSCNQFHLWHCNHHLGFLEPVASQVPDSATSEQETAHTN